MRSVIGVAVLVGACGRPDMVEAQPDAARQVGLEPAAVFEGHGVRALVMGTTGDHALLAMDGLTCRYQLATGSTDIDDDLVTDAHDELTDAGDGEIVVVDEATQEVVIAHPGTTEASCEDGSAPTATAARLQVPGRQGRPFQSVDRYEVDGLITARIGEAGLVTLSRVERCELTWQDAGVAVAVDDALCLGTTQVHLAAAGRRALLAAGLEAWQADASGPRAWRVDLDTAEVVDLGVGTDVAPTAAGPVVGDHAASSVRLAVDGGWALHTEGTLVDVEGLPGDDLVAVLTTDGRRGTVSLLEASTGLTLGSWVQRRDEVPVGLSLSDDGDTLGVSYAHGAVFLLLRR